jgi:type II secretory pathway pseudopilin PulG
MKKINYQAKNSKSGFTLIETFVAITVLVIAVLGPMTLLSRALQEARYVRDVITATYLAQEGVELMIDNRNNGNPFETNEYSCSLKLNQATGYNCDVLSKSNTKTIFKRTISVEEINDKPLQYKITAIVNILQPGFPSKDIVSRSIIFE